jgi:hypothetical protein
MVRYDAERGNEGMSMGWTEVYLGAAIHDRFIVQGFRLTFVVSKHTLTINAMKGIP